MSKPADKKSTQNKPEILTDSNKIDSIIKDARKARSEFVVSKVFGKKKKAP
jgi:hypothetical protein